ncbi:MAG: hypothetical protein ACPG4U_17440, partial [Pseudomonadales bacterium]
MQTPAALQNEMAGLLGYALVLQEAKEEMPLGTPELIQSLDAINKTQDLELPLDEITSLPEMHYAYIRNWRNIAQTSSSDKVPVFETAAKQAPPTKQPLLKEGKLQHLWDQCTPVHRTRAIDVEQVLHHFSRARPVTRVPKQVRKQLAETLLVLDRSLHLAPLWADQLDMRQNLLLQTGAFALTTAIIDCDALTLSQYLTKRPISERELESFSTVIVISDLGKYSASDEVVREYRQWLKRISAYVPACVVLSPCRTGLDSVSVPQYPLDTRRSNFTPLKVLAGTMYVPSLARLRHLGQCVAHSNLEDELQLWQMREDDRSTLYLNLAPNHSMEAVQNLGLSEKQQRELARHYDDWQASLPKLQAVIEQLQIAVQGAADAQVALHDLQQACEYIRHAQFEASSLHCWFYNQWSQIKALDAQLSDKEPWKYILDTFVTV